MGCRCGDLAAEGLEPSRLERLAAITEAKRLDMRVSRCSGAGATASLGYTGRGRATRTERIEFSSSTDASSAKSCSFAWSAMCSVCACRRFRARDQRRTRLRRRLDREEMGTRERPDGDVELVSEVRGKHLACIRDEDVQPRSSQLVASETWSSVIDYVEQHVPTSKIKGQWAEIVGPARDLSL